LAVLLMICAMTVGTRGLTIRPSLRQRADQVIE
jgi:hypothetical protein